LRFRTFAQRLGRTGGGIGTGQGRRLSPRSRQIKALEHTMAKQERLIEALKATLPANAKRMV
jgi:hypothetical protein